MSETDSEFEQTPPSYGGPVGPNISWFLGPAGRMLHNSEADYQDEWPDHVVVFNAQVFDGSLELIWEGDLDVTESRFELVELAHRVRGLVVAPRAPYPRNWRGVEEAISDATAAPVRIFAPHLIPGLSDPPPHEFSRLQRDSIIAELQRQLAQAALLALVGCSPEGLIRYRRSVRTSHTLSSHILDRLLFTRRLLDVRPDPAAAANWLRRTNPGLHSRTPLDAICASRAGETFDEIAARATPPGIR